MLVGFDPNAARQRHEEMLREAANIRLALRARQAAGKNQDAPSLLSRMVKLLSRPSRPMQQVGNSDGSLRQRQLA